MKRFYVTFGGLFYGYHAIFEAKDESIVRAWMHKRSGAQGVWSSVYDTPPNNSKALRDEPEVLCYEKAEHVSG